MKKIIITFISVILLVSFVGCNLPNADSKDTQPRENVEKTTPSGTWSSWIAGFSRGYMEDVALMEAFDLQNNGDINNLIPLEYSRFSLAAGGRFIVANSSSDIKDLEGFNSAFPIEVVKKLDDDHIFVVYNLEDKKMGSSLVYMVFEKKTKHFSLSNIPNGEGVGDYEHWEKTGEYYFVTSEKSSKDYENISIGDKADNVADLEFAVMFDTKGMFGISDDKDKVLLYTYRLLSDGYMLIEFEAPRDPEAYEIPPFSDFVVRSKTFYSYGSESFPSDVSFNDASLLVFRDNQ